MKTIQINACGQNIEILDRDYDNPMTREKALTVCEYYGRGWRLPSIHELSEIHKELFQKGHGNFSTKENYWTSSQSPDDLPLCYSFLEGKSFLADESSRLLIRPVRLAVTPSVIEEKLIDKAIEIFKKYLGNINNEMFRNYLQISFEISDLPEDKIKKTRYIFINDLNVAYYDENDEIERIADFYPDEDLHSLWERWYTADGSKLDDPEVDLELYVGVIDLEEKRYMRLNYFESYDYNINKLKEDDPDWSNWLLK